MLILNNRGFSLVEVLVGMAILTIALAPISMAISAATKSYQYSMSQGRNVMSTREILNAISEELKYATAVSLTVGNSVTIPGSTLTYTVNSSSRTITSTAGGTTGTYSLLINGKTVSISNLQSITFTYTATKQMDITLNENNAAYTNSPTMTTTTTVAMPNI
jgi:prepilin-type N-terminal cleavage/methylation domain-containing protein